MELKQGIKTKHGNSKGCVLKLPMNLYGQKQAGGLWSQDMVKKLQEIRYVQSLVDECTFYHDDNIFIIYTNEDMFFGNSDDMLMHIIQYMKNNGLNIEDQGHSADYVGVNIKKLCNGTYKFT